jgi:hypothetical protein
MVDRGQCRPSAHRARTVAEIAVERRRVKGRDPARGRRGTLPLLRTAFFGSDNLTVGAERRYRSPSKFS